MADEMWKQVFLCGTEWHCFKDVYSVDWDFSHLEKELVEGEFANRENGRLLYLFGGSEPQMVTVKGEGRVLPIPFIVVVDTSVPIPEKIGINSVQKTAETIADMRRFKMGWHPMDIPSTAEPSKKRARKPPAANVFALKCSQRGAALGNLGEVRLHEFDYCMPYIMFPHKLLDVPMDTAVEIIADVPGRTNPLVFEFDWSMDDVDDMVEEKMEDEDLPKDYKATLDKTIRDTVNAAKAKRREERAAIKAKVEAMPEAERTGLKELKTHKFYPCNEDPSVQEFKSRFINRYYGQASKVH